jgi:hypothetical protein
VLTRAQRSTLAAGSACSSGVRWMRRAHEAAQCPANDFAFRGAGCQSAPIRRLERVVSRAGDLLTIEVEANAFLLHMVRISPGPCWPSAPRSARPMAA